MSEPQASPATALLARKGLAAPVGAASDAAPASALAPDSESLPEVVALVRTDAALDKLIASELVHRRGTPPDATYTFKHALVQDAAYESMLKRDRQDLHKQIAEALIENVPTIGETEPELLAHHYTRADLVDMAVPKWLAAGQLAGLRRA